MINKLRNFSVLFTGLALMVPALVAAHVVVTPTQAGIGDDVTFSVSVPNEKAVAVTELKLVVPAGLGELAPTVKPGWQIQTDTSGNGDSAVVTAIIWSGSSIPTGLRDDFTFRAQVPAKATQLTWKAYQTYADGTVVSWDQKPAGSDDADGTSGPYSVTKVVNDLAPATTPSANSGSSHKAGPLVISILALVVAIGAFLRPAASSSKASKR